MFIELKRFPTIDLVRQRIEINSPVTIKHAMADWTTALANQYEKTERQPGIPNAVQEATQALWHLVLQQAHQCYLEKEKTYQHTLHALTQAKTQKQALTEVLLLCETQKSASKQKITRLEDALKAKQPP